jgi:hypothetical protein
VFAVTKLDAHLHHFNGVWFAYLLPAWAWVDGPREERGRWIRASIGVQLASLAVLLGAFVAFVHEHGGTRSFTYGTTLGNQMGVARTVLHYAPASSIRSTVPNLQYFPHELQSLLELLGPRERPPGNLPLADLRIHYGDDPARRAALRDADAGVEALIYSAAESAVRTQAFCFVAITLVASGTHAQVTLRASVDSLGRQAHGDSGILTDPTMSSDGRFIAFDSAAANLVTGDANGQVDVFVRDRRAGTTELVSVDSAGHQGNGWSWDPSISGDGRFVVFDSLASNLVPGDTNGSYDIFLRDRLLGTTERVSIGPEGVQANSDSFDPVISADGSCVAFESFARNLTAATRTPIGTSSCSTAARGEPSASA